MSFVVSFTSTLTGGPIDSLRVYIQDEFVRNNRSNSYKVDISEPYEVHGELKVEFEVLAPNGTEFTINYSCMSDGVAKQATNKPSPVTTTVKRNGNISVILSIPV